MAKPLEYTDEVGLAICDRIVEGESLRSICRDEAMPCTTTVFKWLAKHDIFANHYAHAREAQADTYADEIADIADDGKRDYVTDADGIATVDHDHIARARLRVDARKWIASKLKPKKYGEKVEQHLTGTLSLSGLIEQAAKGE